MTFNASPWRSLPLSTPMSLLVSPFPGVPRWWKSCPRCGGRCFSLILNRVTVSIGNGSRGMDSCLTRRDWAQVEGEYQASSPYNYAVLDDFFDPDVLASIREQLVGNWGWGYKNWQANELYVRDPEITEIA